jgi:hypothetical protein
MVSVGCVVVSVVDVVEVVDVVAVVDVLEVVDVVVGFVTGSSFLQAITSRNELSRMNMRFFIAGKYS